MDGDMIMNKMCDKLDTLFKQYNVRTDISFIAQVQTLISKHNCNYDKIMLLYNKRIYNG